MFSSECAIFSCDDMNKIKVGALAVSRYHQIERLYPTDDAPNVPYHDFPVPGYLLIPSGYMRLLQKDCVSVSSENDPEAVEYLPGMIHVEAMSHCLLLKLRVMHCKAQVNQALQQLY